MKTKKAVDKRERILAAAAKAFTAKAYAEVTLSDVALEAGTFAGSLYYYFNSKEDLVEQVLNRGTSRIAELVIDKVTDLPESLTKTQRLTEALRIHVTLAMERDDFAVAYWKIVDQVPAEIRERHARITRSYGRFWKRLIEEAQAAGEVRADLDARIVSLLLLGSTLYALDWFKAGGRFTVDQLADILLAMMLDGLAVGDARRSAILTEEPAAPALVPSSPKRPPARRRRLAAQ